MDSQSEFALLAIARQHLNIIRQVHGLCLGLTGRLREKTGQKVRGQAPYVDPHLKKWGLIDPLDPVAPRPLTRIKQTELTHCAGQRLQRLSGSECLDQ